MFELLIRHADALGPWEWAPQSDGWMCGSSWVKPLPHPMVEAMSLTDGHRTAMVVRERQHPVTASEWPSGVLAPEAFDRAVARLVDWPAEWQVVIVDRLAGTAEFRTGVWNTVPLYLRLDGLGVRGSWDPVDIYRVGPGSRVDLLTTARALAYWHRYGSRTLVDGVYRLTERASITVSDRHVDVQYPEPAPHGLPRRMADGADPVPVFETLLDRALRRHPLDADRTVVELSGGMDSACVAAVMSRIFPHRVATGVMLLPGNVGAQQRQRRRLMIEQLGLGPDLSVDAARYAPFCPAGDRGGTRVPFDPCGEPYGEATQAMLELMGGAGAHTVVCGVGGDELMALRPDERGPSEEDRQFPPWLSRPAVDMLLAARDEVAPASVINEVTLMAMACGAPRYLRVGMWTLAPLAHPDLVRFTEWLPPRWRRRKQLLRDYLARLGLPDLVVNPPIRENFAPVMQVALREYGLPLLRQWSSDLLLADLGLVDGDAVRQSLADADDAAKVDQRWYPFVALEAGLRSLTTST